jgi:long-chain acyl-CoA synthetase
MAIRSFLSNILEFIKRILNRLFGNENIPAAEALPVEKPPWLDQYEEGVPETISLDQYNSLNDIFNSACHEFSERTAYSNMGTKLSYARVEQLSKQFAAYLQEELKLKKGDRVALMMPNVLQYPVAIFGTLLAGGIVVNVNPMYKPRELEHQLNDSGARIVIILENFAHTLEKIVDKVKLDHIIVTAIGDLFPFPKSTMLNFMVSKVKRMVPKWKLAEYSRFNKVLAKGKHLSLSNVELKHEDIAFLQYTGGTTGISKGVMLSHKNLIANVLQSCLWANPSMKGVPPGITITALPLYHIFALTVAFFMPLKQGDEVMLITNPKDFRNFINQIKKTGFTSLIGVNTLFNAMLNTKSFEDVDFSNLRWSIGAGMAVTRDVAQRWHETTGCHITQGYGLTETSPVATVNPLYIKEFNGSIGIPVSSTEVAVMNDSGQSVAADEVGEICIRGPQVMEGYWKRPEETEEAFFDGGWFRSGDVGHMNDKGFVYLADRKKDMIIVSGFNVFPNEVEDILTLHPGIREAAVVSLPHEEKGEVVEAHIVLDSKELTEDEIIEYCRDYLTGYKVPKHFVFHTELPKTNVGKVLRRALRAETETTNVKHS